MRDTFSEDTSKIMYDGTLECTLRKNFCAVIFYMESDTLGADEDLRTKKLQCTESNKLYHNAHVVFEGGDGIFDNNYEPMIHVFHDCLGYGIVAQKIFLLPHVPIEQLFGTYRYEVNLDWRNNRWFYLKSDVIRARYYRGLRDDQDLVDWYNGVNVTDRSRLFFDDSVRIEQQLSVMKPKPTSKSEVDIKLEQNDDDNSIVYYVYYDE
ncbi:hypothetical protein L3Y34_010814 [Caenorhabditis briggsae]|nr:hypothetical protein L3Y34_010814 [Caenorhabditis briggsae]